MSTPQRPIPVSTCLVDFETVTHRNAMLLICSLANSQDIANVVNMKEIARFAFAAKDTHPFTGLSCTMNGPCVHHITASQSLSASTNPTSVGVSSAARFLRAAGRANVFAQSAKRKVIGGAEEARFAAREGTGETKNPPERKRHSATGVERPREGL